MAEQPRPINISAIPELARLVELVHQTREPRVVHADSGDVAVEIRVALKLQKTPKRGRKTGILTKDDPFWDIVGMSEANERPTDVSENKYRYLAEAYASKAVPPAPPAGRQSCS